MKPRLFIVTKIDSGIAGHERYSGDVKSFAYGPRGCKRAIEALHVERGDNRRNFGNIGAGRSWLELRDETGTYRFRNYETDCSDSIELGETAASLAKFSREMDIEMEAYRKRESDEYYASI